MNLPYGMLSDSWLWVSTLLYALFMLAVLFTAPWKVLLDNRVGHSFFGFSVLLMILWQITTINFPGLNYHYLGAMLLTLMFRWQLAFVAINLVMAGMVINGQSDWQTLPANAISMGLVPIMLSWLIHRLVQCWLPNHFFIYIFVTAFFGAAISLAFSLLLASALLVFTDVYTLAKLKTEYYPFLPLMMFPEAFITGMFTTLLVVFFPASILTFDDERYLKNR